MTDYLQQSRGSKARLRVALWLSLTFAACRPGVGSHCEKGEARCLDSRRALACEHGTFIEVPCRGPQGCSATDAAVSCDIHGSKEGDRCSLDEEGSASCADAATIVACHGGHFAASPCRGPKGCNVEGERALCDTTLAVLGENCREEGKKACATDKSAVLACKSLRMASLYSCRGPRGCSLTNGKLDCDMSVASNGDVCDLRMEGHIACSIDATSTLVCKAGAFVHDENCKAKMRCESSEREARCVPEKKL
jgi:hypothetical protein